MTDALGQWFLKLREQGEEPWLAMNSLLEEPPAGREYCPGAQPAEAGTPTGNGNLPVVLSPAFSQWIDDLRHHRQVRNDDVTLIVVQL